MATYDAGDYRTLVKAKSLTLIEGNSPASNQRVLSYQIEIEIKTTRALRSDEGRPIVRIRTPGQPLDPARPIISKLASMPRTGVVRNCKRQI